MISILMLVMLIIIISLMYRPRPPAEKKLELPFISFDRYERNPILRPNGRAINIVWNRWYLVQIRMDKGMLYISIADEENRTIAFCVESVPLEWSRKRIKLLIEQGTSKGGYQEVHLDYIEVLVDEEVIYRDHFSSYTSLLFFWRPKDVRTKFPRLLKPVVKVEEGLLKMSLDYEPDSEAGLLLKVALKSPLDVMLRVRPVMGNDHVARIVLLVDERNYVYIFASNITGCWMKGEVIAGIRRMERIMLNGTSSYAAAIYNSAALVVNGAFYLLFRAQMSYGGTSRIGLAISRDGMHFNIVKDSVLYPNTRWEEVGGCEDPRIVYINGTFYVTYTAFDGITARLAMASSKDLIHWTKIGPLFPDMRWSKSGAIVCEYKNGKAVPVKINGHYWMYFGDREIYLARSKNLINWTIVGVVLRPREGYFDSVIVEAGPPAILLKDAILLIYNAHDENRVYRVGWAMFDRKDPIKLIARCKRPILEPEDPWEIAGQVPNVVFVEALVLYNGTWYMYYGGADKVICLATARCREGVLSSADMYAEEFLEVLNDIEVFEIMDTSAELLCSHT